MKPSAILSELEREPVVFLGCTWTEIGNTLRKALLYSVIVAVITGFAVSPFLKMSLTLVVSIFSMFAVTFVYGRLRLHRIAGLRAGKPLFYEKHVSTAKSSVFIRPAIRYQRERNIHDPKKKK